MERPAATAAAPGPGVGADRPGEPGGHRDQDDRDRANRAQAEALYRAHFPFVWRSVRRLGVHERSLDDATQDVFMVALRRLPEFDGRASHRAWLFAIATRVAAEHRRRDTRVRLDNAAQARLSARGDAQLELRRRVELLDRLLSDLNPDQREVFIMADVEGFDAPEIAHCLGLKLNTVYSRLRLGRRRFQRALAQRRSREQHEESR